MLSRMWDSQKSITAAKSLQSCLDSPQPHRQQPTRLPRPRDSPGKNTGVGCHFLLQCMKVKSESEVSQSCPTLCDPMDCHLPGSSVHGIFQARVLEWGAIAFSDNGILLSHKKERIWVSSNEVEEPRAYYTEWSKSEREQQMLYINAYISVQFKHSVISNTLGPHGLHHTRPPCPSPSQWTLSRWCHPTIAFSVICFSSCLQSFPAWGSFHMSQFFVSDDQSIAVSASAWVLPMNIQDWFPLGWTGWISL